MSKANHTILITVDLEDWFQVENLKPGISYSEWHGKDSHLEKTTHTLLDLFDRYRLKATFFILGWNAEQAPALIREIHGCGHEIASHGQNHHPTYKQSFDNLRRDLFQSRAVLQDIVAEPVLGYRAPSFSVSNSLVDILKEAGFLYDSSYNSFSLNERYGNLDQIGPTWKEAAFQLSSDLWELPVSNLSLGRWTLPWAGGGYFRLIPWLIFKQGIKKILSQKKVYIFYFHPWEIDSEQPKIDGLPWSYKFRHYYGLKHCYNKLERLLRTFSMCRYLTCYEYLRELGIS